MRKLFFVLLCCFTIAEAATLPEAVTKDQPNLQANGEGTYRFFGLKVYDIRLWKSAQPFSFKEPFALELIYEMNFKGSDIANRSIDEMRSEGVRDEAKLKRWRGEMANAFPDIKPGDRLIGVYIPGKEARFYNSEKFIGSIADAEFADAFFNIWLSEKTSSPDVRKKLLGMH